MLIEIKYSYKKDGKLVKGRQKINVDYDPFIDNSGRSFVENGKIVSVPIGGKLYSVDNEFIISSTKKAKIVSSKSSDTIKVKGLKKGKTTLKVKINGCITRKLKVTVY